MTRKIRIGIFHGIDTPADYSYKEKAEKALAENGIDADVVELRWPSTGTIMGDIWKLMTSGEYREECRARASMQLDMNTVLSCEEDPHLDIVIGHSMGQVMMIEAMKAINVDVPMISIGGALSHPLWGKALRAVGLGKPDKNWHDIPMLWNADDIVTAWHFWQTNPKGFHPIRIAVAGSFRNEHPMELYLRHPLLRTEIETRII